MWDEDKVEDDVISRMSAGFNVDILDLQPKVAVNQSIPADKEAAIEALVKKGGQIKLEACFGLAFQWQIVVLCWRRFGGQKSRLRS